MIRFNTLAALRVTVAIATLALVVSGPALGQAAPSTAPDTSAGPSDTSAKGTDPSTVDGRCGDSARLHIRELPPIVEPMIEALWSFYGSGDIAELERLATTRGLERLRDVDWRFESVERGDVRFEESPGILDFNDWQEWCAEDRKVAVRVEIEPVIEIGSGARTLDAARGRPVEAVRDRQMRALVFGFIRNPGSAAWLLDDVRPNDFRPRYVQPRRAKPCPGFKDPARVADPLLMEPWCTAYGDGRKVFEWRGRPGGELAMSRPTCLAGAHEIVLGLPPGTPMGFGNVKSYIRDPGGRVPRRLSPDPRGFRRDVRPPKDAISSGITNGYATIWTSERLGDKRLLMKVGNRFELWPESLGGCGPA